MYRARHCDATATARDATGCYRAGVGCLRGTVTRARDAS
eukprot:gene43109-54298_t